MYRCEDVIEKRRRNLARAVLEETGLYHSFQLPDGRLLRGMMDLEFQKERLAAFQLPQDLSGKRILDIGPWDGYYTFEMERRGASVTAIDYVDLNTFRLLHSVFHSKAEYLRLDVYELDPSRIGTFDIVLCLGVLYHLKHPLLALERICAVTRDACLIDSFVVDGEARQSGIRPPLPYIEFYEKDELGGQLDNWSGPAVSAVEAFVRAAGFARSRILRVTDSSAAIAAERKWMDLPPDEDPAVEILGMNCHQHRGRCFQSRKEEYIELGCRWTGEAAPSLDVVFPEVDGLGVAPLASTRTGNGLLVSLRVPPGLAPGRHQLRLKIGPSAWSSVCEFYIDLPPVTNPIQLKCIQDGITWKHDEVDWTHGGWMTLWVEGLSPEADPGNTLVEIDNIPHSLEAVHPASGQVNLRLRPIVRSGTRRVRVQHRGVYSNSRGVDVTGRPPAIRGLESLR